MKNRKSSIKYQVSSADQSASRASANTLPDDVVVYVKNVSKKFCKNLRRSMAYGIADLSKNFIGVKPDSTNLRKDEFWALKGISLDLRRGEILGIIGANGSGKSTLLRVITGIFPPDEGEISVKGRVAALIALGSGFHPHMTGKENIYLNGTILGMSNAEIEEKFEAIVEFAEIGDFLDAPVSTYSSGMTVRLGFAIAAHINPNVLIVDEVLAVGDAKFQRKCIEHLRQVKERGVAFILVSHNMQTIEATCDRAILLSEGHLLEEGDPAAIVAAYDLIARPPIIMKHEDTYIQGRESHSLRMIKKYCDYESGEINISDVWMETLEGKRSHTLDGTEPARLCIKYSMIDRINAKNGYLWISFFNEWDIGCMGARIPFNEEIPRQGVFRVEFNPLQLTTSRYYISIHFFDYAFTVPFWTSHYGYIEVRNIIPTIQPGENTPLCWPKPKYEIIEFQ